MDFRKKYDSNDVIALIVKLVAGIAVAAGLIYAGIKLWNYLKSRFVCDCCDCCEDDEEEECCCECCEEAAEEEAGSEEAPEKVVEVSDI